MTQQTLTKEFKRKHRVVSVPLLQSKLRMSYKEAKKIVDNEAKVPLKLRVR